MTMHTRTIAGLGVSVLALLTAMPVAAQSSGVPAPVQSQEEAQAGQLDDVIVTAQRRDQKQQDVPISISTVSEQVLERAGVRDTESLGQVVPSLQFSRQTSNGGAPFIRGVGSGAATAGAEPPVAVYVDDVYIGSPSSTAASLNNVERVEVLKGPQGTLFGRNATGGVVSIHTRRPSHDPELDISAGYGNFDTVNASIYGTTGLSDTVAVNFAASLHDQQEGYGLNIRTGADVFKSQSHSARGSLLWEPSDRTTLRLIADWAHEKGDVGLHVTILPDTIAVGGQGYPGRYRTTSVPGDFQESNQWGLSARLDHDLEFARFASITAYRYAENDYGLDNEGSLADIVSSFVHNEVKTFSQEFQLLAPAGDPLQWIVGLYYYNADAGFLPLRSTGSSQTANGGRVELVSEQQLQSYSAFGEVNFEVMPETRLTLGVRYTDDSFELDSVRRNAAGTVLAGFPLHAEDSFDKLTYRAVVDHHFTPDIMAYGSFSRGFKSGGYNLVTPTLTIGGVVTTAPPVAPEVLDAFEVGLKTELFGNRLRLNPSVYHYDYSNMQVTVVGQGVSSTVNAAAARLQGVDLDFEAVPSDNLRISGGLAWLDGEFTSFPNGPFLVANPGTCTPTPQTTGAPTGGNLTCQADLSGFETPRSPTFTASLNATYTWFTSFGDVGLTGSLYHNSGYTWDPDARVRQPEYTLLGTTLSWTSSDGKYEARIWGRNLTDEYYFNYMSGSALRDSGAPAMPRTYGVSFGAHF